MRGRHGAGLIDVIVALTLLTIGGLVFSATYPPGFNAVKQSGETQVAVAIVQQKLEQVKALGYENLTYGNLVASGIIDSSPTTSPYSFTTVETLPQSMGDPTSTLTIEDNTATTKMITATITWESGGITRNVTLRTLMSERRPWRQD